MKIKKMCKFLPLMLVFCLLFSSVVSADSSLSFSSDFDMSEYTQEQREEFNRFVSDFSDVFPVPLYSWELNSLSAKYSYQDIETAARSYILEKNPGIDLSKHFVFIIGSVSSARVIYMYLDNIDFEAEIIRSGSGSLSSPYSYSGRIRGTISDIFSSASGGTYTRTYYSCYVYESSGMLKYDIDYSNDYFNLPCLVAYNYSYVIPDCGLFLNQYPYATYSPDGNYPQLKDSDIYLFLKNSSGGDDSGSDSGEDIPLPDTGDDITDSNFTGLLKGIVGYFNGFLGKIKGYFTDIGDKIVSFKDTFVSKISDIREYLHNNIWVALTDIISKIQDVVYAVKLSINLLREDVIAIYKYITDTSFDPSVLENSVIMQMYNDISGYADFYRFDEVEAVDSISFPLDFTKAEYPLNTIGVVYINFDWYIPHRDTFAGFFLVFLYVGLIWRFIRELPSLISGLSGSGKESR